MSYATRGVPRSMDPYILVDPITCCTRLVESSSHRWMGRYAPWIRAPSMDLSTSRVQSTQESPTAFFIPFISPRPLFPYCWPTPPVDFSSCSWIYPRVTGSTSMCKDQWMEVIHESRATGYNHLTSIKRKGIRMYNIKRCTFVRRNPMKRYPKCHGLCMAL